VQHTLYTVWKDTSFFTPHHQFFLSLCILKSPDSLPGGYCLGPLLWQLVIKTWLTSILEFWYPRPSYLVQEVLVVTVFVFSVLYTKKCCRAHSSADTVPAFFTILQFSSELSNNWGTGLLCLRPLWIYCTGQQHKASLFPCLFSCLSSLCLQLLRHGSYLSFARVLSFHTCTITSPFLRNADFPSFKQLPSPSRSHGMPLSALLVP